MDQIRFISQSSQEYCFQSIRIPCRQAHYDFVLVYKSSIENDIMIVDVELLSIVDTEMKRKFQE